MQSVTLLIFFSSLVTAFPTLDSRLHSLHKRAGGPIDVTGEHQFRHPQENDQRGPCPGLNALANHGYIGRTGIVGLAEVFEAVNGVFNMGIDLATIIPIQGVLWAGDPLAMRFSIGGPDQRVGAPLGGLLGLFGQPQGLDWTHNFIEGDSSPTRNDVADTGDCWTMNTTRWQELMDFVPKQGQFTHDIIADWAMRRFHQSIAESPNFWYGPYSGFIARNAGYCFLSRLFANYSGVSSNDGVLTHETLRNFFGVDESGKYNRGWERIPQNWTPRPTGYTLLDLNLDLLEWAARYPELASIGGNMGEVNTFTPVDLGDPVSGLKNAPRLLEGNNFVCFALQVLKLGSPTYLNNAYTTLEKPLGELVSAVVAQTNILGCPAWDMLTHGGKSIFEQWSAKFPGARNVPL